MTLGLIGKLRKEGEKRNYYCAFLDWIRKKMEICGDAYTVRKSE